MMYVWYVCMDDVCMICMDDVWMNGVSDPSVSALLFFSRGTCDALQLKFSLSVKTASRPNKNMH